MRLSEPFAVVDTYATGIGRIEKLKGGNVRVVFYAETEQEDGSISNVIVAKIVTAKDETEPLCH